MVYGIINNLITFIFVLYPRVYPLQAEYENRKNLTRDAARRMSGWSSSAMCGIIPGCNAFHIFLYSLVALYFVVQLILSVYRIEGSVAMLLLLFFLEKIIEILGMGSFGGSVYMAQSPCIHGRPLPFGYVCGRVVFQFLYCGD